MNPRQNICVLWLLGSLGLFLGACGDDPRVSPAVKRDLTRPASGAAIDIPLRPVALSSQQDFDVFERDYLTTLGRDRLIQVYTALAQTAGSSDSSDPLLLQRLALLELAASTRSERLQRVFRWADKLRSVAPNSPHTLYLLSYIKGILLQVGRGDGSFRLDSRNRDIAEKLLADWDRLLKVAPNYQGPAGASAKDIRRDRQRLAAVLRGAQPPQQTASPGVAPREATPGEVQARTDLWRFEHGSDNERNTLCAERDERGDTGGRRELELWMDLRCAALQGKVEPATQLLKSLGERIPPDVRCRLAGQAQTGALRWGRAIPDELATVLSACAAVSGEAP